jgi:aspartate-semialdehyde dehydrogenase
MSPIPRLKIGVVGATGIVGAEFLKILNDRRIPIEELRLFASDNSKGAFLQFREQRIPVQSLNEGAFNGLHVVFFSSGDEISKEWAPRAVKAGAVAVDNSAAFRLDPEIPLIVPEVNGSLLPKRPKPCLIANPNCSTIQLVVALKPLQDKFGLHSVRVATYQSVSGAGRNGSDELEN